MSINKIIKERIRPWDVPDCKFDYEVVKTEKVRNVEYVDTDGVCRTYPETHILIRNHGSKKMCNYYYCTTSLEDAEMVLRVGDIISCNLKFRTNKDNDGNYIQQVFASDIHTIDEYRMISRAEI